MDVIKTIWSGLDWSVLTGALLRILPALLCITVHETCHGLAALALGDTTAKREGRLTLNPLRHIDPMGLLMMLVFRFGWAKPVPVNMYAFRKPKQGMAITALAGPLSNFLLGFVFLFLYGALYLPLCGKTAGELVLSMLYVGGYLSFALSVFNLLPIPPLDGSKILFALLPDGAYRRLMRYERYGSLLLLALVFFDVFSKPLAFVTERLFDLGFSAALFGLHLVKGFF